MNFLKVAAGSIVINQDLDHPMAGEVIDCPEGQKEYDEFIWVKWGNGLICQEDRQDVTLTACLYVK